MQSSIKSSLSIEIPFLFLIVKTNIHDVFVDVNSYLVKKTIKIVKKRKIVVDKPKMIRYIGFTNKGE